MNYNRFIINILVLCLPLFLKGQYLEVGVNGGGSNFLGDVGNYGFDIPRGFHAGGLIRYNFNEHWSVRLNANYGEVEARDSWSSLAERKERNLSFRSEIREAYLVAEFNFFPFEPGRKKMSHTPYINGGFGVFSFSPEAYFEGTWHDLRSLRTEGQGTSLNRGAPYATASSFFIFSMGYKWSLARWSSIALESSFRTTYTDYLDDVSGYYADPQVLREEVSPLSETLADRSLSASDKENTLRGNPANRDWYIFTGVTIQFKFGELYEKCASFVGKK